VSLTDEQLAALTEKERHDLRYGCEGTNHGNCELTEAHLTALADARLEVAELKRKLIRQVEDADRAIARLKKAIRQHDSYVHAKGVCVMTFEVAMREVENG